MKFLRKLTDAYSEVPKLQQRAANKMDSLMSALLGYRLMLREMRNRARHLDDEVRKEHIRLQTDVASLSAKSNRFWYKFPWSIGRLHRKWLALMAEIDELEDLIDRAMKGTKFYNKMLEGKEALRKQRKLSRGFEEVFTRSVHSLVRIIHYALVRERMQYGFTKGSELLTMEAPVTSWIEELKEIHALEETSGNGRWDLVTRIAALRDEILQTKNLAEKAKILEDRFLGVVQERESGIGVEDDPATTSTIDRLSRIVTEEIPSIWERTDWKTLTRLLRRANQLLGTLESSVQPDQDTQPFEE